MGTRAVYSFFDNYDPSLTFQKEMGYHVYKHWDGYPEGAAGFFANTLEKAWKLPRYEADEFAAAFVAVNKGEGGGNVRLCHSQIEKYDIEYVYEIFRAKNQQLIIKAYTVDFWDDDKKKSEFFYGRLKDFIINFGDNVAKKTWDTHAPKSLHCALANVKESSEYKKYLELKEQFEGID